MTDLMVEMEEEMEDEDFLSQVAALEADAISIKRRKISTTVATSTSTATPTANLSKAKEKAAAAEGAYTAALRGSRSLLFQQTSSRANGKLKTLVANNHVVFANTEFGGGGGSTGRGGEGGGGSCFKCGKSGHCARDCNVYSYPSDNTVPEKACPCGLGTCMVLTANTEKNRGRKFYKCPLREDNGGCGFFEWCDKNMGTDNMNVRSQGYGSNPSIPDISCPCGAGFCLKLTAKTGKNIGQQFYRCPAIQGSSCGFFKWCCDHTSAKTNEMSNKTFGIKSHSQCFKCGEDGHWAKDCFLPSIQNPPHLG
ncbi:hypothetical protein U1Q18_015211 [Sarracenia purpurea var. burkii]